MALEALSTQATVEARASAARVKLWTDKNKDGTPDPTTLDQGFQFATGLIFGHLVKKFGETVLASWTISTAPAEILRISDALCMWYFSSGNNSQNELVREIYQDAVQRLIDISSGARRLYGVVAGVTSTTTTDTLDDPFEDEGAYWNE